MCCAAKFSKIRENAIPIKVLLLQYPVMQVCTRYYCTLCCHIKIAVLLKWMYNLTTAEKLKYGIHPAHVTVCTGDANSHLTLFSWHTWSSRQSVPSLQWQLPLPALLLPLLPLLLQDLWVLSCLEIFPVMELINKHNNVIFVKERSEACA